jgi:hypothetical protein
VEIGGTWINDPALYTLAPQISGCDNCGEWYQWAGPMDVAIVPPNWTSWASEAAGGHDQFWRDTFRNLKTLRAGKGTTYVRPWHEFNGDWMDYSVRSGEAASFKASWNRVAGIARQEFPEVKLMLGASAAEREYTVAELWPSARVDVLSIDFYNNWPFCTTQACFNDKIENSAGANSLEDLRRLAVAKGVPVAISEWGNQGQLESEADGGGGESPQFIDSMHAWFTSHAGTGPGQVVFEVYFNLWSNFELLTESGTVTSVQPDTAQRYAQKFRVN